MRTKAGLFLMTAMALIVACGSDDRAPLADKPEEPTQAKDPNLPSDLLVPGIKVKDIAVFQGVKVPVVEDGDVYGGKVTSPVVADRPGIIRVYVDTDESFKKGKVTAELRLVGEDGTAFPTIRETKTIEGASTEEDADSTFNLEFPASSFPKGVSFQVWLTSDSGTKTEEAAANPARYPQDGTLWQDVGAETGGKMKIVLVPVIYTADGSNRAPTTDDKQLDLYKQTMMARYPTSEVELTVHKPFKYEGQISGQDGQAWSDVLAAIRQLRYDDKVDEDVYYYGTFMPTKSFQTFCTGGCIAGLSTVAEDYKQDRLRASVGVGYPGQDSADTMAHEVGHAHGREHAPCGNPDAVDPKFPYKGAELGAWGYNILSKEFYSPKESHDMMAYCPNNWVSDYTYNALFKRIKSLNAWMATKDDEEDALVIGAPKEEASAGYAVAAIDGSGNAKWELDTLKPVTGGIEKKATILGVKGDTLRTTTARFFPYDHIPGGILFVPKRANESFRQLALEGYAKPLVH
jgi:hypothetical protein